jgi:hypothetical protein
MALYDRSEPRDLLDVGALLGNGGDLDRALEDASRQFTGLTKHALVGVLRTLPLERLATVVGWSPEQARSAESTRVELLLRLASHANDRH